MVRSLSSPNDFFYENNIPVYFVINPLISGTLKLIDMQTHQK